MTMMKTVVILHNNNRRRNQTVEAGARPVRSAAGFTVSPAAIPVTHWIPTHASAFRRAVSAQRASAASAIAPAAAACQKTIVQIAATLARKPESARVVHWAKPSIRIGVSAHRPSRAVVILPVARIRFAAAISASANLVPARLSIRVHAGTATSVGIRAILARPAVSSTPRVARAVASGTWIGVARTAVKLPASRWSAATIRLACVQPVQEARSLQAAAASAPVSNVGPAAPSPSRAPIESDHRLWATP